MKIEDLLEGGNTSVGEVLSTIRAIYNHTRAHTSDRLCHAHTARSIDPAHPSDMIILYGFGDFVSHSALIRDGQLLDNYAGVTSSTLLPSGDLQINVRGNIDVLTPVFTISVRDFLETLK